jgi:hypothetical protein
MTKTGTSVERDLTLYGPTRFHVPALCANTVTGSARESAPDETAD